MRNSLFNVAAGILVLVAILNYVALKLYFYWTVHYFDSLVHFLAGISVGLASLWFVLRTKENNAQLSHTDMFRIAFMGSLAVGIVWELFELAAHITSLSDGIHYVTDTASDILMDVSGGIVAAAYALKLSSRERNTNVHI